MNSSKMINKNIIGKSQNSEKRNFNSKNYNIYLVEPNKAQIFRYPLVSASKGASPKAGLAGAAGILDGQSIRKEIHDSECE